MHYTLDKIQMLKKISFGQNKRKSKCSLLSLSQAPAHYSFTFSLRFLDELKLKVCLSKTVCSLKLQSRRTYDFSKNKPSLYP